MAKKKSSAQLDREINESLGVPAWARGLDLSESRKLAARLGTVDVEAKQRTIENDRRAALPNVSVRAHEGPSATSSSPRGVTVDVHSSRLGAANGVLRALRSYGLKAQHGNSTSPTVFVPCDRTTDLERFRQSIVEALRYSGYRV